MGRFLDVARGDLSATLRMGRENTYHVLASPNYAAIVAHVAMRQSIIFFRGRRIGGLWSVDLPRLEI